MIRSPTSSRGLVGFSAGAVGVVVLTLALAPFHAHLSRAVPALVLVLPVIVAAVLGGVFAAVAVALAAGVAFSLAFIPPVGTLDIDLPEDSVALVLFVLVAITAGVLVAREVDRRRVAEARRAELLEHVDRQRAALLRSVSHDLRTPLSIIRAVASDLRDEPGYDESTRADLLDLVNDEADRLDRIVANVLSLSRIEAGALTPNVEAVDIVELLKHAARRMRPLLTAALAAPRSARRPAPGPGRLHADRPGRDEPAREQRAPHTAGHDRRGVAAHLTAIEVIVVTVRDDGRRHRPRHAGHAVRAVPLRATRATTGIGLAICGRDRRRARGYAHGR